jgi:hypothetical protein
MTRSGNHSYLVKFKACVIDQGTSNREVRELLKVGMVFCTSAPPSPKKIKNKIKNKKLKPYNYPKT